MDIPRSVRFALSICAAAGFLVACGGASQPGLAPSGPAQQAERSPAVHPNRGESWMAPDAKGKRYLLYVSDVAGSEVYVFSYPRAIVKGILTGFKSPYGDCSDSAGHVYITDFKLDEVFEFAHGGTKPINTISLNGAQPVGCAVDQTTGNLAVSLWTGTGGSDGGILVYAHGSGTPMLYTQTGIRKFYPPAYDNQGNLFAEGVNNSDAYLLSELPSAGSSLEAVSLNQTISYGAGVAWDGKYLAVGDNAYEGNVGESGLYQFSIAGTTGTLQGSTQFDASGKHCSTILVWQPLLPKLANNEFRNQRKPSAETSTAIALASGNTRQAEKRLRRLTATAPVHTRRTVKRSAAAGNPSPTLVT